MKSETTIVATQYRLQQWTTQIQECQNRPEDMSVRQWCVLNVFCYNAIRKYIYRGTIWIRTI